MANFSGKTVIVTGSSRGIGRRTAALFAAQGANVVLHGQSADKLQESADLLRADGVPANRILTVQGPIQEAATQDKLIGDALAKFGRIDVLVNNAGVSQKPGSDLESGENFRFIVDCNLVSAYELAGKAYPELRKTRGNIVNVSSIFSTHAGTTFLPYRITKAGMDHMTRGLAIKYGPEVRVNTVAPGATRTEFMTRHGVEQQASDEVFRLSAEGAPLGRVGTAEDVAQAILFLAGHQAAYISGVYLPVDGGTLAGTPHPFEQEMNKMSTGDQRR